VLDKTKKDMETLFSKETEFVTKSSEYSDEFKEAWLSFLRLLHCNIVDDVTDVEKFQRYMNTFYMYSDDLVTKFLVNGDDFMKNDFENDSVVLSEINALNIEEKGLEVYKYEMSEQFYKDQNEKYLRKKAVKRKQDLKTKKLLQEEKKQAIEEEKEERLKEREDKEDDLVAKYMKKMEEKKKKEDARLERQIARQEAIEKKERERQEAREKREKVKRDKVEAKEKREREKKEAREKWEKERQEKRDKKAAKKKGS
jgi:hypothetical protein